MVGPPDHCSVQCSRPRFYGQATGRGSWTLLASAHEHAVGGGSVDGRGELADLEGCAGVGIAQWFSYSPLGGYVFPRETLAISEDILGCCN